MSPVAGREGDSARAHALGAQVEVHPALYEVLLTLGADPMECTLRGVDEWSQEDAFLPAEAASIVAGRPERGEVAVPLLSLAGRPLRRELLHPAVHTDGLCLVSLHGGSDQLVVPPALVATAGVSVALPRPPPQPRCHGLVALAADTLKDILTGAPVLFRDEIQALWLRVAAALPRSLLGPCQPPADGSPPLPGASHRHRALRTGACSRGVPWKPAPAGPARRRQADSGAAAGGCGTRSGCGARVCTKCSRKLGPHSDVPSPSGSHYGAATPWSAWSLTSLPRPPTTQKTLQKTWLTR